MPWSLEKVIDDERACQNGGEDADFRYHLPQERPAQQHHVAVASQPSDAANAEAQGGLRSHSGEHDESLEVAWHRARRRASPSGQKGAP